MSRQPADSPYHRRLPVGEVLDASPLVDDPLSSFAAVTLRELEPMLVPELPRAGEEDRAACGHCRPSEHTIWQDDVWQARAGFTRTGIPFVGGIAPRQHVRLEDAPLELLAGLGPLMQRVSAAVKSIPGVARCHFARWGDGSEHFHLWALARPERQQMAGARNRRPACKVGNGPESPGLIVGVVIAGATGVKQHALEGLPPRG